MALFIAKSPTYRSKERVPARIGVKYADLRPSRAENEAISNLGRLLVTRADEMKKERDAAVVGEMYNKWRDADREQLAKLGSKKGKDAVNLHEDYDEFFTKSRNEAHESAENGSQQAMIVDKMSRRREQSLDSLAQYEAAEGQRYKRAQHDGLFKNFVESAREGAGKEDIIQAAIAEVRVSVDNAFPGMGPEEREAKFRADEAAIRFAAYQAQADTDPIGALVNIELHKKVLGVGYHKLKAKATPIRDAYTTDAIVAKVNTEITEPNPDAPFDIEKRYDRIKELTKNPEIRKAAFGELEKLKRIHDNGIKERFNYYYSAISSMLQQDMTANIADVKRMAEFNYLPKNQQDVALAKAQTLINQRDRSYRAILAAERSAAAADRAVEASERATEASERAKRNQEITDQQRLYDTAYNRIMGNEQRLKELGTMSDEEFNALVLDVGDKNQAKLLTQRQKLQDNRKYLSVSRQRIEIVNTILRAANITDQSDRALYMDAVIEYIGDETDPKEIKKKAAEAMQNAAMGKKWLFWDDVKITDPGSGHEVGETKVINGVTWEYKGNDTWEER